jgi:hypothetical protein
MIHAMGTGTNRMSFYANFSAARPALRRHLPGYADFANRIRYRLVPGLW